MDFTKIYKMTIEIKNGIVTGIDVKQLIAVVYVVFTAEFIDIGGFEISPRWYYYLIAARNKSLFL